MKLTEEQIGSIKIEDTAHAFLYRATAMINGRLEVVNVSLVYYISPSMLYEMSLTDKYLLVKSYFVKIMEDVLET